MNHLNRHIFLLLFSLALLGAGASDLSADEPARSKSAMVATVNPIATDAGVAAFQKGGNAVDAAIAAGLALGIVDNHNSGIGGGCFILIRRSNGELLAIDGREIAPAAATRDMFIRNGKPDTNLSQIGPLAIGVPGAIAAYEKAIELAGNKSLAEWLNQTAPIAEKGFRVGKVYAQALKSKASQLSRFPASKAALLKPDGTSYAAGQLMKQQELGNTYRMIAKHGSRWFYHGEFARKTATWMKKNGGLITASDFGNYRAILRKPIVTRYRGYQIVGFPPPSSGGIHVAQILNILEPFEDLESLEEPDRIHLVTEAMKFAFADRAHWLGDSDFAKVPRGLLSKEYARSLSRRINIHQAIKVKSHGVPPDATTDLFGEKHTTHIATADAEGNWVAMTQTINTTFGSKVVIPGTGVVMNNEMDDFSIAPGIANAFGLVGAKANSVEPGKRPLSSMSPTIVIKNNRPVLTLGAAGGPKIITQALLGIVRFIDLDLPIDRALANPRFHHQWSPDRLLVESSMNPETLTQLRKKGHALRQSSVMGVSQAIALDKNGWLIGVHDPRVPGKASGK